MQWYLFSWHLAAPWAWTVARPGCRLAGCVHRVLLVPGEDLSSAPALCGAWLSVHQAAVLAI